ncbi:MAG: phosphoglycolate phosphatase [Rubritepida sp.]|nr:phosphoglycolate phosphatase [Rubritepida sp.]
MIQWVVFDVGGVLVDEARLIRGWADVLGLSEAEFTEKLREGIAAEKGIGGTIRELAPEIDIKAHRARLNGLEIPGEADLYPDVRAGIASLRAAGFRIGIAGNQPPGVAEALEALDLGADFIATSAQWGVSKPDAGFFEAVLKATGAEPAQIAYVGDRLDNDVEPARAAGLHPVFIPRGIWGEVHDARVEGCTRVTALTEIYCSL